jgi:hypothetical protein
MAEPTQMITVQVPLDIDLHDTSSEGGKVWERLLNLMRQQPGYKRLYWGRRVEIPEDVQLHVGTTNYPTLHICLTRDLTTLVRGLLQQHHDFLSSPAYSTFLSLVNALQHPPRNPPNIRHALISTFSPSCKSLGLGSPVTGTAIYLNCSSEWEQAWALWVSIVQHVPGFMGIAGGPVLEPVKDRHGNMQERCYVAVVGWENVEVHDAYHHTQHFWDRRRILLDPAKAGFVGYGHIAFGDSNSEAEGADEGKSKL